MTKGPDHLVRAFDPVTAASCSNAADQATEEHRRACAGNKPAYAITEEWIRHPLQEGRIQACRRWLWAGRLILHFWRRASVPPKHDPKRRKPKKVRVQIGNDLDFTVGLYVSPRAMTALCTVVAACIGSGGLIQR